MSLPNFPKKEFHCGYIYFLTLKVSGNGKMKSEFMADLTVKMILNPLYDHFNGFFWIKKRKLF